MKNIENKLVTLNKFCELTGAQADTIRKNIRAGGLYAKYSQKIGGLIHIYYEDWYEDNNKIRKMAA